MTQHSYVLAIDIGTTSLKTALVDENGAFDINPNGQELTRVFFSFPIRPQDWFNAVKASIEKAQRMVSLSGIVISGNGPTIVSHDAVHNDYIMLWNEAGAVKKNLDAPSIFLPRLELFKEKYPKKYEAARYFFSAAEYIVFRLTGCKGTVLAEERYQSAYWDDELLISCGYPVGKMPSFVKMGEKAVDYLGISVFFGPPDFIAALIGTNTLSPQKACDRIGSSEGLNICIKNPVKNLSSPLRLLPSLHKDFWNVSYLLPQSGIVFADFMKRQNYTTDQFEQCVQDSMKKGADDEGRRLIESIAFNTRIGCDLLEEHAQCKPLYVLAGGQANNKPWLQIKANLTNRRYALLQTAHAELLGDAAIAFASLGVYSSIFEAAEKMVQIKTIYEPDKDEVEKNEVDFVNYKSQQRSTANAEKNNAPPA